ncbi:MAG: hypothetical protein AB1429_06580 [Pseudomonadota bacterium]
MTIKPNRFDLVAGVIIGSFLVLGLSWELGFIAVRFFFGAQVVSEGTAVAVIAILSANLAMGSFVVTQFANLSVFRVRLLVDSIEIRGMLRNRRIRAVDIDQIYFTEYSRYGHIVLSFGPGSASMSSLLWSREAFYNLMAEVASWAARLEMPAPVTVDTVNPGKDEVSKRALKKQKSAYAQDWVASTLIFAALTLFSTLLQAILPSPFQS